VSSHLRPAFAAFLVVAGFSTPASSNAFTDLFSPAAAPEEQAAAAAPAKEECLPQPGRSTAQGQRWVYRYDGHRKCWFQAAEETALAKKPARHLAARRSVTAPEQDTSAPRKQEDVGDARAEMVNAAPEQTPQPAPTPKLTVVRTVRVTDAEALVPAAPVLDTSGAGQPTPDQPAPRRVDVEQLLSEAPAASSEVASAPPASPIAAPGAKTGGVVEWMASRLGVLLIVLGGAALLISSLPLWRALWPVRFPDSRTELPDMAHDRRRDPSFGERIAPAGARRDELLHDDPQSVAPSVNAAPTRRTEAPAVPAQQALWEEGIGALAALASPVSPEVFLQRRATAYRGVE
jgi:hypothetical protein